MVTDESIAVVVQRARVREFRVRGRVQGVGFRPAVWRIARELGLAGEVLNDGDGVLLRVGADEDQVAALLDGIERQLPRLARIDGIEHRYYAGDLPREFRIGESAASGVHTEVTPDAAICPDCAAELCDPARRRFRYPFTNCTHCGPRLSIITAIPYDRGTTTMAAFALCAACRSEYRDPHDRRFHAEPIACPDCGPRVSLVPFGLEARSAALAGDAIGAAVASIRRGEILAVKGLGGYHLACDATNVHSVARLRQAKRREAKPFALMARDLDIIRRYCNTSVEEERLLTSVQAPIVLLHADSQALPEALAPGLRTLGFMLPTTPLHLLLLSDFSTPLVMTSGNLSDEPTITDDAVARRRLSGIAAYALTHDRRIANRVDDSVVRVMDGRSRVLRRARGLAPAPLKLPPGFEQARDLLAMGGELKATFCLVKDGEAILSQHQGDLENALAFDDYRNSLALYQKLFDHSPAGLIVDLHPDYLSSKLGRAEAERRGLPLLEVQHHHAHVAACMAENGRRLDAPPVLGIALDGLGFGDDGSLWGGEFLLADYRGYTRLGSLKPVAMLGGAQAAREPWRNLYAHLAGAIGWDRLSARYSALEVLAYLNAKPHAVLDAMMTKGVNAPLVSSCGRLFDAMAAALGICRGRQGYEGDAAARLEALAEDALTRGGHDRTYYPFKHSRLPPNDMLELDPAPLWHAVLDDLAEAVPATTMALRFHRGLARALVAAVQQLAAGAPKGTRVDTVVLSGGSFQNRILLESVAAALQEVGFIVLSHAAVPTNDGGLALGQAAIGAARLAAAAYTNEGVTTCA